MHEYKYSISLRISHPNLDPRSITEKLELNPFQTWQAGEPKTTPKGTQLEGSRKDSYWVANLHEDVNISSEIQNIEDFLNETNQKLIGFTDYFNGIVEEGGYIQYFIGVFDISNIGIILEPSILLATSKLNISIGLDIYSNKKI